MSSVKAPPPTAATPSSVSSSRPPNDPNTQLHPPPSATASAAPSTTTTNPPTSSSTSTSTSTSTTNGTTTSTSSTLTPAQPENVPRSKYKTFILSNGVFEVEQRYEIREIIGQGAYGVVCSALDMKTNTLVAIKKIENVFDHRSLAKRTLRELKLCRYFQHENILSLERVMRPHSPNFNNMYTEHNTHTAHSRMHTMHAADRVYSPAPPSPLMRWLQLPGE